MLIQFNFKNFRSFRDATTLDMSATKITEFPERVTVFGKERVLPVAAIYGANASGKSNVYRAFVYMSNFVENSFALGDDEKKYQEQLPSPFLFDSESELSDSSFEVYFSLPFDDSGKVYNYGFSLGRNGVVEEWLNYKMKTARSFRPIFYRNTSEENRAFDAPGIKKANKEMIERSVTRQVLVVSLGSKLQIDVCKMIRDWFLNNTYTDFADIAYNLATFRSLPDNFIDEEATRNDIIKYFSSFDNQIRDFKIEKKSIPENSEKEYYLIDTIHRKCNSNGFAKIPLQDESAGTLKMFALYSDLKETLKTGGVFFADELNARLHPLLVRNIILTFLNPKINKNHAQLIFTTHDAWLLSKDLFRRDEIWFVEKGEDGVSSLYSLAEFKDNGLKIRKDESYEKNYLLGKYGAIPSMKAIDIDLEN